MARNQYAIYKCHDGWPAGMWMVYDRQAKDWLIVCSTWAIAFRWFEVNILNSEDDHE